ncbi:MAG: M48 family metallopeptidase [Crocinitomicaceae bacterium]
MLKCFGFIGVVVFLNFTYSQDLNQFSGLKSTGKIPSEFLLSSTEKYKQDFEENENDDLKKEFFLSTRFVIDQLLQSGKVLFNDPVSDYLNEVAKYALKTQPELLDELRFYVLKSTTVNAFSTDQGIIFFTTGLLAQLENEAQLAYIICHEVSHFTEKHVQDSYVERKEMMHGKNKYNRMGYDDRLNEMSVYKKSNELEADSKGVDIYLETEYAVDEIVSSFGVLLYSYLPFQDLSFSSTFLNTEYLKIPNSFYPDTINQITKEEDYDDRRSSHPNIKTRIDNSVDIIDDRESQGTLQFKISKQKFVEIRNLARFETLRLKLTERKYGDVIYDVFLLNREFENNEFLEASLMKAFYGLSKYKNAGRFSEVRRKLSKVEGESYPLHGMLYNLSKGQFNVIAYRYASDLCAKYPDNDLYMKYKSELKTSLALNKDIKIESFESMTSIEAKDSMQLILNDFNIEDSIKKIESSDLSKYQKIKRKKALNALLNSDGKGESLVEDNFHYYALSDLIENEDLIKELKKIKENAETSSEYSDMISLEKNSSLNLGIDSIVIIDPYFTSYKVSGEANHEKSEKFQRQFTDLYMEDYRKLDLHRTLISPKSLSEIETEKYNQLGELYIYLSEIIEHDDIGMISSNHENVKKMSDLYGTTSFLYSKIDLVKERKGINIAHIYGLLFVATIPLVAYDLRIRNYLDCTVILIDTEHDELMYGDNIGLKANGNKRNIDFLVFHVLKNINSKAK